MNRTKDFLIGLSVMGPFLILMAFWPKVLSYMLIALILGICTYGLGFLIRNWHD